MQFTKELFKNLEERIFLTENQINEFSTILTQNWFDSPFIISKSKSKSLERINIPSEIVLLLIQESSKMTQKISTKNIYKDNLPQSSYNYNIQPHLEPFLENEENKTKKNGKTSQIFLNEFRTYQPDKELQIQTLKKLKFILAKILNNPDIASFRTLNPKDFELNRLIFNNHSLSNLITYLGFELNKDCNLYLELETMNSMKLQECMQIVKDLRKEENKIDKKEVRNKEIIKSYSEKIELALQLLDLNFREFLAPKVKISENEIPNLKIGLKDFDSMTKLLDRQKLQLSDLENQRAKEKFRMTILEEKNSKDIETKLNLLKSIEEDLEKLKNEMQKNEFLLEIIGNKTINGSVKINPHFENLFSKSEFEKEKTRNELKKKLRIENKETEFPEKPVFDSLRDDEFNKLKPDFEAFEEELKMFTGDHFKNDKEFIRLECYAKNLKSTIKIKGKTIRNLEIEISKGEKMQLMFDLICLKLGLENDEYDLYFDGSEISLTSYCADIPLIDYHFDDIEHLTLVEKNNHFEVQEIQKIKEVKEKEFDEHFL